MSSISPASVLTLDSGQQRAQRAAGGLGPWNPRGGDALGPFTKCPIPAEGREREPPPQVCRMYLGEKHTKWLIKMSSSLRAVTRGYLALVTWQRRLWELTDGAHLRLCPASFPPAALCSHEDEEPGQGWSRALVAPFPQRKETSQTPGLRLLSPSLSHPCTPTSCLRHTYMTPMSCLCHAYVMPTLCLRHSYMMPT